MIARRVWTGALLAALLLGACGSDGSGTPRAADEKRRAALQAAIADDPGNIARRVELARVAIRLGWSGRRRFCCKSILQLAVSAVQPHFVAKGSWFPRLFHPVLGGLTTNQRRFRCAARLLFLRLLIIHR